MSEPSKLLRDLYPGTLDCVHCGLCLPVCPTYRITGRETSSPRGRLYLMRGAIEGEIPVGEVLAEEAYLCLGCRACETACPSGVRFGAMLEEARAVVEEAGLRQGWAKRVESWALRELLPRPRWLHWLVGALGWVQRLRLDRLALSLLPARLREAHELVPVVPPAAERVRLPSLVPAQGTLRGRVALFEGCIMPELFGRVNLATARVLARNGFEVLVPPEQCCCGALQAHAGEMGVARDLARRNLAAFDPARVDAIVVNSAGCGAFLRESERWLPNQAEAFAASVRDICEFLEAEGIDPPSGSSGGPGLLRRSLPSGPRPTRRGRAAAPPRDDSGTRADRSRRPDRLLWRRGNLQSHPSGDVPAGAGEEDERACRRRPRRDRVGQPRLPDPARRRRTEMGSSRPRRPPHRAPGGILREL